MAQNEFLYKKNSSYTSSPVPTCGKLLGQTKKQNFITQKCYHKILMTYPATYIYLCSERKNDDYIHIWIWIRV